jgi:ribonucleotide reductase alpha subunit
MSEQMMIIKRDGRQEPVSFDKILIRIQKASEGLNTRFVKPEEVAKSVIAGIYDGCTTKELDTLAATVAANKICDHPDYSKLASYITVSRLHKETPDTIIECVERLWNEINPATGVKNPKIREDYYKFVTENAVWAQALVDSHSQYDYRFDFPGIKSLEQSYLLKNYDKVIETPQYLWFRVAYEIHRDDKEDLAEAFSSLSQGLYIHATPTLFNSGLNANALSSCFLYGIGGDSLSDIFDMIKKSAMISKNAGGIGMSISNIRAAGAPVRNGDFFSSGIVPMLRVLNDTMRYCDQSGKRPGAAAVYLEPWHSDIMEFLELRLSTGKEELRTRDLFTALWMPDRFMKAVENNEQWYMFSPDSAPGLQDVYGEEFDALYESYVEQKLYLKVLPAQEIWKAICKSQIETGTPYIVYKDSVNKKSNHKNLGTIRSSNLCVTPETTILTDRGHLPIGELEGQFVNVWNGEDWSYVQVKKTSESQEVIRVVTNKGRYLDCTPYHKFFIAYGGETKTVEAKDLLPDDIISECPLPEQYKGSESFISGTSIKIPMYTPSLKLAFRVDSVGTVKYTSPTYCVTEPKHHRVIFNGIPTSQCSEIVEYYDGITEIASCNLASIILPEFFDSKKGLIDTYKLEKAVKQVVRNLDKVIDNTAYVVEGVKEHNFATRPLGIGAQGFADLIAMAGHEYDSKEAKELTVGIFEHMYYYALEASCELAQKKGAYAKFKGSPVSQGLLQFDLWDKAPRFGFLDWKGLKEKIKKHGIRNSLLLTIMPNASTSVIAGVTEACEPITSNLYTRKLGSKNYTYINKHLVRDLEQLGLWSNTMLQKIMLAEGSIAGIKEIPMHLQRKYATAYEISAKAIIDHAALRGIYIDQSQSMNIFMRNPTVAKLTSMHFYGWKSGLKTGMYYLRSNAAVEANKVTVDKSLAEPEACDISDPTCEACSA